MRTKQEILARLRQELHHLQDTFGVEKIGIFGSYARDEATLKSDIDLLVKFTRPPAFARFMELEEYLNRILGINVDLVPTDALKEYLQPRILNETIYA